MGSCVSRERGTRKEANPKQHASPGKWGGQAKSCAGSVRIGAICGLASLLEWLVLASHFDVARHLLPLPGQIAGQRVGKAFVPHPVRGERSFRPEAARQLMLALHARIE